MTFKRITIVCAMGAAAALLLTAPGYADAGKHGDKRAAPQTSPMPGGMMTGRRKSVV